MATIRSYTTIEQSRKLAEILPNESADMRYGYTAYDGGYDEIPYPKDFLIKNPNYSADEYDAELPCWSLAALLDVLPEIQGGKPVIALDDNYITYPHMSDLYTKADNLVDACVEMILKLKERKLL